MRKLLLFLLLSLPAFAQSGVGLPALDQYGGISGKACSTNAPAINHFYTELSSGGRWHLCTPVATPGTAGNWFFYIAGANVQANISCTVDSGSTYPQRVAQKFNGTTMACTSPNSALYCLWAGVVTKRMKDMGFNATSFGSVSYTDGWDRLTPCNGIVPIATGFNGSSGAAWSAAGINPYRIVSVGQVNPAVSAVKNAQSYISDGPVKDIFYAQNTGQSGMSASSTQLPDLMDSRLGQWVAGELANDGISGPGAHLKQCIADSAWCPWINLDQHDNNKCSAPPYLTTGLYPSEPTGKQDVHCGWIALVTAPFIAGNGNKKVSVNALVYPDDINYTKQGLIAFMTARYGTIGALNTAWGTSYTGFTSARTHVTSEVPPTCTLNCVGDGATTTFTFTTAHANVDWFSVRIKVNGVVQGVDCPKTTTGCSGAPSGGGNTVGNCTNSSGDPCGTTSLTNPITGGSGIYATGVFTNVVFTAAPANGVSITVDYDYGGFPAYANTLADEDGTHLKAYFSDFIELNATGVNPTAAATVKTDLEDFMFSASDGPNGTNGTTTMWGFYFRQLRAAIKAADPNMLYGGSYYQCGQWRTPCHPKILQAAAAFVDLFQDTMDFTSGTSAARMASLTSNLGDIPIVDAQYITFIADSRLVGGTDPQAGSPASFSTAGAAGAFYASELSGANGCWNLTNAQGHHPCVGYTYWNGMAEQKGVVQPGLVSSADNPYDGNPRNTGVYTDDYGYNNNITAGATESKIYGDFLSPAIQANQKIMWLLKAAN